MIKFMLGRFQQIMLLQTVQALALRVQVGLSLSVVVAIIGIIVVGAGTTPLAGWAA